MAPPQAPSFVHLAALAAVAVGACSIDGRGLHELLPDGGDTSMHGPASGGASGGSGGSGGQGTGGRIFGSGSGGQGDSLGTGGQFGGGTGGIGSGGVPDGSGGVASGGVTGVGGVISAGGAGALGGAGGGTAGTGVGLTGGRGPGAGGGAGGGMAGAGGRAALGCNANTCPSGCCENDQCITTHATERCGMRGAACAACKTCFRCSMMGACEVIPTSSWKLVCSSAVIAPTMPNGDAWDTSFGTSGPGGPGGPGGPSTGAGNGALPDPICSLTFGFAASNGAETSVLDNTLTPMWNESITPSPTPLTAAMLMSQTMPWSVVVGDDDNRSSVDPICKVSPTLTQADFTSTNATFTDVQSCTSLTIHLVCSD